MHIRQAYDSIVQPVSDVDHFPIYKKPMETILHQQTTLQTASLPITLLQKIFETPFDTHAELENMLQKDKQINTTT